ncbi:unnamed protein product, partial [Protopolystoma xenopodis]
CPDDQAHLSCDTTALDDSWPGLGSGTAANSAGDLSQLAVSSRLLPLDALSAEHLSHLRKLASKQLTRLRERFFPAHKALTAW